MAEAHLNVFQRLARTWDAVHPYNAAQACLIAGSVDAGALADIWPTPDVVRVAAVGEDLSTHFSAELNRPFGNVPFRPFVQPCGDAAWLGIAYQHAVADSYSVRGLLQRWIERVIGIAPLNLRPANRVRCEGMGIAPLLQLIRRYGQYRRVRKVHTMGPLDHAIRVRVLDRITDVVPAALAYARSHGVKLNDIFVAAMAEACSALVPMQQRVGRRDLAVSSIADLRPYLAHETDRADFGCHLGFTAVVCGGRVTHDWPRLLQEVARQNQRERSGQFGPPGVWWMHAAEVATRFTRHDRLYDFYRKEAPFAGGISNVNLNDTWLAEQYAEGRVLDYVRVSPTGPMVPVVMNVTTLGDDLRLSMTYRSNLFNDWTAGELAGMFVGRVERVAGDAPMPAACGGRRST